MQASSGPPPTRLVGPKVELWNGQEWSSQLTSCWAPALPSLTHTDLWPTLDCLVSVINICQTAQQGGFLFTSAGCLHLHCWVTLLCFNEIYWDIHLEGPRRNNLLLLKKVRPPPGLIQPYKMNSFHTNLYNCSCLPKTYLAKFCTCLAAKVSAQAGRQRSQLKWRQNVLLSPCRPRCAWSLVTFLVLMAELWLLGRLWKSSQSLPCLPSVPRHYDGVDCCNIASRVTDNAGSQLPTQQAQNGLANMPGSGMFRRLSHIWHDCHSRHLEYWLAHQFILQK